MPKPGRTGLNRLFHAFGYSWLGFKACFKHEAAFRQELFLGAIMLPCAVIFADTYLEMAVLIGSLFLVLAIELLNSGLEAIVDRVSDDHHELSGRAKDLGSAAVTIVLINVIVIWSLIFIPKYI